MLEKTDLRTKKMSKAEYKPVHDELIEKLVVLQQQARSAGVGMIVLVEGWSGAGKGSRISELVYELDARATKVHVTEDVNPRAVRKFPGAKWGVTGNDPLMKQFWQALGERGEITFFRSRLVHCGSRASAVRADGRRPQRAVENRQEAEEAA